MRRWISYKSKSTTLITCCIRIIILIINFTYHPHLSFPHSRLENYWKLLRVYNSEILKNRLGIFWVVFYRCWEQMTSIGDNWLYLWLLIKALGLNKTLLFMLYIFSISDFNSPLTSIISELSSWLFGERFFIH